jgi:hypothetical protein
MINSGQFLIPEGKIELKQDTFKVLVDYTLGFYNRHVPIDGWTNITVQPARQYQFTGNEVFKISNNDDDGVAMVFQDVPVKIVDLVPIRISGVYPFYLRDYDRPKSYIEQKVEYPVVYRRPVLTVPISGDYDCQAIFHHKSTLVADSGGELWEVKTITDEDQDFIKLLTARFMVAIGRNRRAFTLTPLPITSDASEMVSEGREMEKDAEQSIYENKQKFYLAISAAGT